MTNRETFPMRPNKAERYRIEREKDEKFSNIPVDLKTEYSDLKNEMKGIELEYSKQVEELSKTYKQKKKLNLINLEANREKMEEVSGLTGFDLLARLPKDNGQV